MLLKNLNLKYFLSILLLVSGVIWFVIVRATGLNVGSLGDFIRSIPQVVTVDFIPIVFFMKWGWRWKWLQGWLVPFPDLNGSWTGYIQTNWKDANGNIPGPIPVMLTINQTFVHISCVMRTAEMVSSSYLEGFCIDSDRQIRQLCYSYTSRPKVALRERSTPHDGTILFDIVGKPIQKLEGEYWTQRQTTGTVTLTFKTKDLLDELPPDFPAHPMAPLRQGDSSSRTVNG